MKAGTGFPPKPPPRLLKKGDTVFLSRLETASVFMIG
jgi:hypothetical protein